MFFVKILLYFLYCPYWQTSLFHICEFYVYWHSRNSLFDMENIYFILTVK